MAEPALIKHSLAEAAAMMDGVLSGAEGLGAGARWSGAAIDSRRVAGGELFFALQGEQADGHDFAAWALAAGAAAAVVHREIALPGPSIRVADAYAALHQLTRAIRRTLPEHLVGITGSAGKTTTKELVAAFLGRRWRTEKSPGNYNNLYGFPLALLGAADDCQWLVAEMGMSVPGELAAVSRLGRPDVAVYTNVRPVHLENFGTLEAIAEAKSELLAGVPDGGVMVANADDPRVMGIAEKFFRERGGVIVTYGLEAPDAQVRGRGLAPLESGPGTRFTLESPQGEAQLVLPIHGLYNVENCLAAAACALHLGLPLGELQPALDGFRPASHRGEVARAAAGFLIVDDCYNSNPDAAKKALLSASRLPGRRHVAVLGDMLELGPRELEFHSEVGQAAAQLDFDFVLAVGQRSRQMLGAFLSGGGRGAAADNAAAAIAWLKAAPDELPGGPLGEGDVVLVKASRGMALESVVEHLRGTGGGEKLMLYHLLYPLHDQFSALNVFRYLTFRTAGAIVTALLISLFFGPWFIATLRRLSVGQNIRDVGPQSHQVKSGTPTMGGIMILTSLAVATLLWANLTNPLVWLALGVTLLFGAIGFADDFIKVKKRRSLGLTSRVKFLGQVVVAGIAGWLLMLLPKSYGFAPTLNFPFLKYLVIDLGWLYVPFVALVLVGASNAVNLTDGLDGLAIGSTLTSAATYAVFCYVAGNKVVADYLQLSFIPGAAEVTIFCGALAGASLGFLWFNSYPAEVFMGDVGSLALGGALGMVAVLSKQELLLVVVGGLFVLETGSVILQVASFKLTGKRIFRMSPLHHHFELKGWSEPKVIVRFWILAVLFALLSLSSLKLR